MDLNEFNDDCVNKLLDNIKRETKTTLLLGDFNIYLLKYEDFINMRQAYGHWKIGKNTYFVTK